MSRKEEIIQRIQKAALDEFIQKGVASSSMEGIAKSAKTTKRTLYKYYPSKDVIFDDILQLLLDGFETYSNFTYNKTIPIEQQIDEIINTKVELLMNNNYINISKLLLIELLKSNPLNKDYLQRFNKSERKFINWIKAAQKDNAVSSKHSAKLIANQFHSIIKGLIFYPVLYEMENVTQKDIKICKATAKEFFLNSFC